MKFVILTVFCLHQEGTRDTSEMRSRLHGGPLGLQGETQWLHGEPPRPRVNLHGPKVEATQLRERPTLSTTLRRSSSKASGPQSMATV
jgi:hypothetical protein